MHYKVIEYEPCHQTHYERTWGVMAYSDSGDVPLGIDAHWFSRDAAELARSHFADGLAAHGRTTEAMHRQIWALS